jgi:hypothetical protein
MLVTFGFGSIQTLGKVSWLTTVGFVSIMASIITVSIAVGVTDRPAAAPQEGPWDKGISAFKSATFLQGISAIATAVCKFVKGGMLEGITHPQSVSVATQCTLAPSPRWHDPRSLPRLWSSVTRS